ncbi:TetR/AcrR family transcriptional regulator, partial [Bacillus luteolus]
MNDKKKHVIKMAHQLFIEKGFQATSIQDILDYSGIAKGTFYNYFSSKNELLMELLKTIYRKMEQDRNELLLGQDPANLEIFIKQIELQMETNRTKKLVALFEEVNFSDDKDLKNFIIKGQLRIIRWFYRRFIDIFGENKKPYLLDCAIMFNGIIYQNMRYSSMAYDSNSSIHKVVQYSVNRIVKVIEEVSQAGEQLIDPEVLTRWFPDEQLEHPYQHRLYNTVLKLKASLTKQDTQAKYHELLDFIQSELTNSKQPRIFLIESAFEAIKNSETPFNENAL